MEMRQITVMHTGYWNFTASIDWCEENFIYSHYIAEFWNTMSSVSMIVASKFIRDKKLSKLMAAVGIGSVFFHMTLSKYAQALDEVPMIWMSLLLLKRGFDKLGVTTLINTRDFLGTMYGITATFAITIPSQGHQFKLFHTLNTFLIVFVVFVYRILAIGDNELFNQYIVATNFFGIGFVCWLIDLFLCEHTRGIPLHALWHVFSSMGVYNLTEMLL